MRRNRVSERASFFGKIYRRERYPKEMIYILADEITRTNDHYAFAPISSLCKLMEGFPQVLAALCCCFWGNALFPKQTLPPFYSTLLLYAGCHFTHQTDTFPVLCSIRNKLPISIIFWLVDQRKKIIWSTLEYTYLCVLK